MGGVGHELWWWQLFFAFRSVLYNSHVHSEFNNHFQGDIHSKLETLALHFNSMTNIVENTFVGLKVRENCLDDFPKS